MFVTVVVCLVVKECYPFSHFPMYSGIAPVQHYFYLEDPATNEPVMTRPMFGISASAMKKTYHSHLHNIREVEDKSTKDLTPEDYSEAGSKLIDQLIEKGKTRDDWREAEIKRLRLMRVDIERTDTKGIVTTPSTVVEKEVENQ